MSGASVSIGSGIATFGAPFGGTYAIGGQPVSVPLARPATLWLGASLLAVAGAVMLMKRGLAGPQTG